MTDHSQLVAPNRPRVSSTVSNLPDISGLPVTTIRPTGGWISLGLRDVWRYRELLGFLTWRDVKVRYKQTVIGILWVVLQPLLTMLLFTFVFSRLAKLPSQGIPYPLFVYSGLLPWQLFTSGLSGASTSIVGSAGVISKIYFPRLIIPLSSVIAGVVDFLVSFTILVGFLFWYHTSLGWTALTLPLFLLFAMVTAFGVGLWLSMLNVKYRDVQYTIPFLMQIWLFATPVAYASNLIPPKYRLLFALNPMTSVVDGFRWALLGTKPQFGGWTAVSVAMVIVILLGGLVFFRRTERTIVDVI